jgi:hypothetical protein
LEWVSASEGARFQEVITSFTNEIRTMGPMQLKEWKFDPTLETSHAALAGKE